MAATRIDSALEIWKPCPDFAGIYAVSNFGRVKRLVPGAGRAKQDHVLATAKNRKGYHYLNLCRDGKMRTTQVHVLVCRTFHGEKPTPKHQAAHRDDDKDNNTDGNLYWATGLENHADRRRNGGILTGSRIGMAKLTEADIPSIRAALKAGGTHRSVAVKFGVSSGTIAAIVSGKTWGHVA